MGRPRSCLCDECPKCKHRAYMNGWYAKNAERARETARESRERRIESVRAYDRSRGYRVYDATKVAVRKAVHVAIQRGDLERQPCQNCGEAKTDAHHPDYSKPLDVLWLCRRCHGEVHRRVA